MIDALCRRHWRKWWLLMILCTYILLAAYQLGLPGLHYDEAREAGLNAVELLTGAPVTAFRNVTFSGFGRQLPVMVQDYIGALNVYIVLPVLWLTGIGVPNLRIVSVLTGLATLLCLERATTAWMAWNNGTAPHKRLPLSHPGLLALTLLVASPSFVFWSRQGIFVTNITQPLTFWSIWQGIRWLHDGRPRALLWSAFAAGCALYAKLLTLWLIGPFALLAAGWWLWQRRQKGLAAPLSWQILSAAIVAFAIPLLPFFFFNWQSGGTWQAIAGNLDKSYYGVANTDLLYNAAVRSRQLVQVLTGQHLWYLGGLYGNGAAPWLAGAIVGWGLWRRQRLILGPAVLALLAVACSLVTISDLFITHYALIQPLLISLVALAFTAAGKGEKEARPGSAFIAPWLVLGLVALWVGADVTATVRYHLALARSGGLGDHSDVSYHLAYHLRYNGLGAPLALDWGFDAPVRYLSEGTVTPIELFGYASPTAPDSAFGERLRLFLGNQDNVYLLHTPAATSFQGRREEFFAEVSNAGLQARLEATFSQRDGVPLIELWRVLPP